MKTAQFTLTTEQAKRLIARAVFESEQFQIAFRSHRVLFKGSTTVSALSQLAANTPMRICGRVTEKGLKAHNVNSDGPHWMLYEQGEVRIVDDDVKALVESFGPNDLFITGANAIDAFGNAALLCGSPGGSQYGEALAMLYTEGCATLVLTTSDKMIPGNIKELYGKVRRKGCDYAMGMACGLAPIPGEVITEQRAIEMLADVQALIFARGGLGGAAGSSILQVTGEQQQVEKILCIVDEISEQSELLGSEPSLTECSFPCVACGRHLSCKYAKKHTIYR